MWPDEDGWPYSDPGTEPEDPDAVIDDDVLDLHPIPARALSALAPLERASLSGRFGLDGEAPRSIRTLQAETGASRQELKQALASGLAKLRAALGDALPGPANDGRPGP